MSEAPLYNRMTCLDRFSTQARAKSQRPPRSPSAPHLSLVKCETKTCEIFWLRLSHIVWSHVRLVALHLVAAHCRANMAHVRQPRADKTGG